MGFDTGNGNFKMKIAMKMGMDVILNGQECPCYVLKNATPND